MPNRRMPNWLLLIVALIVLLMIIPVLWIFVSVTATPLHPNPESVPTSAISAPSFKWISAIINARQQVLASVTRQNLPGLSVAVGHNGEIVWAEGFGFAELKTNTPVTLKDRFRIGTASTALTSVAAGLLIENGRLKIDEEIQTYVPAFPRKQWPVTMRQLMGHTSGLDRDGGEQGPLFTKHCQQPAEASRYFANSPLRFEPQTLYSYSSNAWILVSSAIEATASQPLYTFMREKIFNPLGMHDTIAESTLDTAAPEDEDFPLANMVRELIYDPEAKRGVAVNGKGEPPNHRVTSYFTRFASDPKYGMHLMRPLDFSCYAGASGFLTTPSDLVRLAMALNSNKLLQPSTLELLQNSQVLASGTDTGHGLGWRRTAVTLAGKQTRAMSQDGEVLGGKVASLITFPEYGISIAVTSNISYAGTPAIAQQIAEAFIH